MDIWRIPKECASYDWQIHESIDRTCTLFYFENVRRGRPARFSLDEHSLSGVLSIANMAVIMFEKYHLSFCFQSLPF